MIRQFELVERIKAYDPAADEDLINRAYVFAMKAHGAQTRASGDPYFSHPLEVAGILTDFNLDTDTIVTALLHDTIEDTTVTLDDIEAQFGKSVARLVDGVSSSNPTRPTRQKTSANSCLPCQRTSVCFWSSSLTGCTT